MPVVQSKGCQGVGVKGGLGDWGQGGWGREDWGWSQGSWGWLSKVMPKYGKIFGYRSLKIIVV